MSYHKKSIKNSKMFDSDYQYLLFPILNMANQADDSNQLLLQLYDLHTQPLKSKYFIVFSFDMYFFHFLTIILSSFFFLLHLVWCLFFILFFVLFIFLHIDFFMFWFTFLNSDGSLLSYFNVSLKLFSTGCLVHGLFLPQWSLKYRITGSA